MGNCFAGYVGALHDTTPIEHLEFCKTFKSNHLIVEDY